MQPLAAPPQDAAAARKLELEELNRQRRARGSTQFLVPLLYAPLAPLVRLGLRSRPVARDIAFGGLICAALVHAGSIMFRDSSV